MLRNLNRYVRHPRYRATGTCFLVLSILFALWVTRIPEVKTRLNLTDGDLGTALFFLPLGAITSMLLITNLIKRLGEGRSSVYALCVYSVLIVPPMIVGSYAGLCVTLFFLGISMGWVDISINAVANTLEKTDDVKIMSTSHGFFSLGGIIGGVFGGYLAELGVSVPAQMGFACFLMFLTIFLVISPRVRTIHDTTNSSGEVQFALPSRQLLGLAVIAFCIMMAEGAITDWSTVYLSINLNSSVTVAGIGFAVFSAAMTFGRFNGDQLIHQYGHIKVLLTGLSISTAGLLLLQFPNIPMAIAGFGLAGLGYSAVIPIVFSQASKKQPHAPAHGLAAVATLGYFGFLTGPVLIGWLAEWIGLGYSFAVLLLLTILALVLTFREKDEATA